MAKGIDRENCDSPASQENSSHFSQIKTTARTHSFPLSHVESLSLKAGSSAGGKTIRIRRKYIYVYTRAYNTGGACSPCAVVFACVNP